MGLVSWVLTFPASRRTQFLVKLAVALVDGIGLSLIGMVSMDALVSVRAGTNQFTPVYELRPTHFKEPPTCHHPKVNREHTSG